MTYLQFHVVFTLPWLAILGGLAIRAVRQGRPLAGPGVADRLASRALWIHLIIAFVYTTPWDNYLVFREVWGYPPGRVLATIFYVPVEEYAFFLIQTAGTALFLYFLLRARRWARFDGPLPSATINWLGAGLLLMLGVLGAAALTSPSTTYLGLITAWALPVIALQWGFGGDLLLRRWRLVVTAIALPTLWLWMADRIAIGVEIWWISPTFTTGIKPFGLPLEEALFFLVTNVLVVFGIGMALDRDAFARLGTLWDARQEAWRVALLLWVISMVPAPLVPDAFPVLAYVSTGLLTVGVLGFAVQRFGAAAYLAFGVAVAFGIAVEAIGVRTGFPFGAYTYTASGPTILGVPWLVPLGWWSFTILATLVAPVRGRRWWAPLALVAWDVALDPLMVQQGFWRFDEGRYFGVPLSNFVGWYLAGWLLVSILLILLPRLREARAPTMRLVYGGQAAFMAIGLTWFGLPVAGAVAAAAMGIVLVTMARGGAGGRGMDRAA